MFINIGCLCAITEDKITLSWGKLPIVPHKGPLTLFIVQKKRQAGRNVLSLSFLPKTRGLVLYKMAACNSLTKILWLHVLGLRIYQGYLTGD